MPRTPACKGTCVRELGCTSCARCVPRYICCDVAVTPGPYSDIACCNDDGYGSGHFSFRLTYQCGSWSGTQTCIGLAGAFDLTVTLTGTGPDCETVITSTLTDQVFTFTGVLPAGMTGTIDSDNGDVFDWEISSAEVVENPLIKERCSPCTCATVLPRRLCVVVTADGDAYTPPIDDPYSFLWNCDTHAWEVEGALPDGLSITIALKGIEEGICGIDVAISGDYGSYSGVILLESDLHSRKIHGTICRDTDLLESTLGVPELIPCDPPTPCEDPPPQDWVSYIDETISLTVGEVTTGTVTIKDQSCGPCIDQDCAGPPIQTNCCAFVPIPQTLHAQWSYGGCTPDCAVAESVFNYDPDFDTSNPLFPFSADSVVWVSNVTVCGQSFTAWLACKDSGGGMYEWGISVPDATCIGGGGAGSSTASQVCSPFSLSFGWSWTGDCCPDGGAGVGMLVDIIV